jgi:acetoin utilization deacetylase AcuC-like enzyme
MNVTEEGFSMMSRAMLQLAETYCGGKIAFLLEGGYDLAALKSSVAGVLETLQQPDSEKLPTDVGGEKIAPLIRKVLRTHEQFHRSIDRQP